MKQALKVLGVIEWIVGGLLGIVAMANGGVTVGIVILVSGFISGLIFLSMGAILEGVEENKASLEEVKKTLKDMAAINYKSNDDIKMTIKDIKKSVDEMKKQNV